MVDITAQHWYTDIFRAIMAGLDKFIYSLLSVVYNVLFKVAGAELLDGNLVKELFGRIQLILGVIILFKVAISLFNGIMNPDSLKDSKNGFSGVIKRVVTVLIMMILIVPLNIPVNNNDKLEGQNSWNVKVNSHGIIFGTLYELQRRVLEDNIIGKLITGINESSNTGNVGENFSRDVLKSFLTVSVVEDGADISDECHDDDTKCVCTYDAEEDKYDIYFDESSSPSRLLSIVNGWCRTYGNMSDAAKSAGVDEDAYAFSYSSIWSTIIGALFVFLVLSLTIDIAVRVFKLAMLQLLAPIPILSYIDPKSEQTFKNWTKTLTQVYLDLFVRLAIISFIIFIFNNLSTEALSKSLGTGFIATVSKILIYLGIIMFAKQAPKFITDTLGIKAEGLGGLFSGLARLSAAGSVAAGAVGSFAAGRRASILADENNNVNPKHWWTKAGNHGKHVLSGITGAAGGALTGITAMSDAKDHYGRSARQAINQRNTDLLNNARNGGTFFGAVGSEVRQAFVGETSYDALDAKWKAREQRIKNAELTLKKQQDNNAHRKSIMDRARSKAVDSDKTIGTYSGITGNYREFHSVYTAAMEQGVGVSRDYIDAYGHVITESQFNALSKHDQGNYNLNSTFFNYNGMRVDMAKAQSIDLGLLDANTANFYEQVVDFERSGGTTGINDASILADREAYRVATGGDLENKYDGATGLKASFGNYANDNKKESDRINREREQINNERQGASAQRAQANATRFKNKK